MSGRESVSSLWSVGGVLGFEVRNVLNIKGVECSAKKAVPLPVEPAEGREEQFCVLEIWPECGGEMSPACKVGTAGKSTCAVMRTWCLRECLAHSRCSLNVHKYD